MEQVPETGKMKSSRVPTLKLKDSSFHLHRKYDSTIEKPFTPRRPTESVLPLMGSPLLDSSMSLNSQLESSSPSQERQRLRFSKNSPTPPPIYRTQSMPGYYSTSQIQSSPNHQTQIIRSPGQRLRFPRKMVDEVFVGSRGLPGTQNLILEEDESSVFDGNILSTAKGYNSLPRPRRPASPRLTAQQIASNKTPPSSASITFSPSSYSSRFSDQYSTSLNYCYSGSLSYPGSFSSYSVNSTPTSARSRSSSISSLETIPDSPDAEEAAIEADRIARSKAEAEVIESCDESKLKFSRDANSCRGRIQGSNFVRDKRKRWSVCGAERRGDLNLDTIWED
ncbi:hypothetical protein OnM2_037086 [Erysiphe neolycopersici]|uniref:Uncharacterized protein n=1 Tax=Erysiphe neolycopersici TaxID=212602 RepID=A0A420HWY6_9PEZI|nr:hypothetical protein OnM2_037086 [Erysiphe neolycopersici]